MAAIYRRKKLGHIFLTSTVIVMVFFTSGCGGSGKTVSYADGTYTGTSPEHTSEEEAKADGYGVVDITITDGKITDCVFKTYELDGTLKDEDYGKSDEGGTTNRDFYNKAQKSVASCDEYAKELVESQSLDDIDSISGATLNYDEFKEAVEDALSQAEENS